MELSNRIRMRRQLVIGIAFWAIWSGLPAVAQQRYPLPPLEETDESPSKNNQLRRLAPPTPTVELNADAPARRRIGAGPSSNAQPERSLPLMQTLPVDSESEDEAATREDVQRDRRQAPWWQDVISKPLRPAATPTPVSLEQLLAASLVYSPYVQVIKELPLVRETSIMEADAEFDWVSYIDSLWSDISEPVGSRLTTGGPDRLRDDNISTSLGVRRKNTFGGQLDIGQRIGHQDTNSIFFVPPNQGTARFTINYTQPLLRNAGRGYNTALTVLASLDTDIARADFSEQLQTHLLEVTRAYWNLYLQRANLLQKQRLLQAGEEVLKELERRREIDALLSQIIRARAAVERRRADILRSRTEVKNAESRIRTLVNAPILGKSTSKELIPQDQPLKKPWRLDEASAVEMAIQNRPEMVRVLRQIRAAGIRLNVAKNELLPALNLIIDTYVSGLRGNSNIGNAWLDQWSTGEPAYSIGLQYEFPLWNRAAQARYQRRRIELRQLDAQLKNTIENLRLDVQVAVREVATTHGEMMANFGSMKAAEADVNYLYDRWQTLPGSERTASLFLEDLLEAQERLNVAEFAYLDSQNKFCISHMQYLKAVGTLLQHENVSVQRYCECHLPTIRLQRMGQGRFEVNRVEKPTATDSP